MKIFITGGTGFVGSHLTKKLAGEHDVTVGSLEPSTAVLELPEEVDRERVDVTNRETLDFSGFDCVIHLVALSPMKKPPVPYERVHVDGTRNVVKQAEKDGVEKFFHMSALGADPEANTEYLRTKGKAEEYVRNSELAWRIFRPSIIFGKGGEFLDFISKMTTPLITLLPGKDTDFQPVHVEDLAEMIRKSLEDIYTGKIFEIGGPEKLSMGEIAKSVDRSKGKDLKVVGVPQPLFLCATATFEQLPLVPFGIDQYRSLKNDNAPKENQAGELGIEIEEMKKLEEYLGEK